MAKNKQNVATPDKPAATPEVAAFVPPMGMTLEVWNALPDAAKTALQKPAKTGKTAAGIVELTIETAQAAIDGDKYAAMIRANGLGTIYIVPTIDGGGIYTLAVVKDGKVNHVEPAHVDRVKSPRHLPRALRLAGSWLGENGGDEFKNGPTGKKVETPAAEVTPAPTPEPAQSLAAQNATATDAALKNANKGGKNKNSKK